MISEEDLIDIVAEALTRREAPADWRAARPPSEPPSGRQGKWGFHVQKPFNAAWTSLPMKRPFISEYMVKQMLLKEQKNEIRIPKAAILSPLAEEWLTLGGIQIRREG